jgi:hypothetical protein
MAATSPDPLARARLRGKRAALGVVIGVATLFIAASSIQIVPAIFGANVTPLRDVSVQQGATSEADALVTTCAKGIRQRLDRAIDRASARPGSASPAEHEWPDEANVRGACEKCPGGLDAWASLSRLRSAETQLASGHKDELEPLLRDVDAHLPSYMR